MSTEYSDPCDLRSCVIELDESIHVDMLELKRLTDMYNLGYRYLAPDGSPHMGASNVVNIATKLVP